MQRGIAKWCVLAVLQLLLLNLAAATEVRAWLDRDSMHMGETVALNIEVESGNAAQPDFSALQRDFATLGTQSSRQVSLVNGQTSSKTLWAISLMPHQVGTYTIAPITIGDATTPELHLTVLAPATDPQRDAGEDVFIEVSAEPENPYVQQQVRFTVKLYFAVDLTGGTLEEPQSDTLLVRKLGRDTQYAATVAGRRYQVLERRYALTAEKSGPLTLAPIGFRGSAPDSSDPSGFFRRSRAVSARSAPVELQVRAKPASWGDAPWLPAQALTLEEVATLPTQSTVGEPLTRSLRMRAEGLAAEQLPELDMTLPAGSELYPDQAELQTRDDGNWLQGERTRKFAIVPAQPGTLSLPAVSVRWWNTSTDRAEIATLPARSINIVAAGGSAAAPVAGLGQAGSRASMDSVSSAVVPARSTVGAERWQWLAVLGFTLWLLTLAGWWWSRQRSVPEPSSPTLIDGSAASRAAFLRACAMAELASAERELLAWARSERKGVRNLGELAKQLAAAAQRDALLTLQQARYASAPSEGLPAQLKAAFQSGFVWAVVDPPTDGDSVLPELYPRTR